MHSRERSFHVQRNVIRMGSGLTRGDDVLRQVLHVDAVLHVLPNLEVRRLRVEEVGQDLIVDLQEAAPEHALPRRPGLCVACTPCDSHAGFCSRLDLEHSSLHRCSTHASRSLVMLL